MYALKSTHPNCSFLSHALCSPHATEPVYLPRRVSGHAKALIKHFIRKIYRGHILSCLVHSLPPTEADLHELLARLSSGSGCFSKLELLACPTHRPPHVLLENHLCPVPSSRSQNLSASGVLNLHLNLFLK